MVLRNVFKAGGGSVLILFIVMMCSVGMLSAQNRRNGAYRYDARSVASYGSTDRVYQSPSQTLSPVPAGTMVSSLFQTRRPPVFAIKANLVYAATLTPNLGFEFGLGQKTTLEFSGGYNGWGKDPVEQEDGTMSDEKKLDHWLGRGEFKYWLKDRFSGHYFGVQAFYADFDIHGYKIPDLLEKEFYNDGTVYGGGISYGYHWVWSKRWGMEFNIGAGMLQMDYKEKECDTCSEEAVRIKKTYFGPISAGIKLVFIIK